MTRPILYGHRGAAGVCPENSYASFATAVAHGATALELDVRRTRDGAVVVFHDADGRRMAGVADAVDAVTFQQMSTWDLGHGFRDASFVDRRLSPPLLRDVLRGFPGLPVNIDLKSRDPRLRDDTLRIVHEEGATDRVVIASFYDDVIRAVIASGTRCRIAVAANGVRWLRLAPLWLVRRVLREYIARGGTRVQIPTHAGRIRLDAPWFIARCHALGFAVDYWVINDVDEGRELLARGADGLISDHPQQLSTLFARPLRATPTALADRAA
jgi:glycerophosphoryl diester phosphodiesterase